jgi:DNA-binding winged helix-turn-helix (wHTH) protein
MPESAVRRVFRFGVFEADESSGELRKQGLRVKLHSQPFQVLLMLLERPSDLVTREEMRQRIWGEETFVDFDHSLNSAISKIRIALNDSSAQPRYVETVAGKGYRFIAPVSQVSTSQTCESQATIDQPTPAAVAADVSAPARSLLSTPEELPAVPRKLVAMLLVLIQLLYLSFYLTALANLREVSETLVEMNLLQPQVSMVLLIATAAMLIPVRLYLIAAVCLGLRQLPAKFARMFPLLLILDLVWALSPFLLIHHVSVGLALGFSAALVYLPFAQRSLILMYGTSSPSKA